MMKKLYLLLLFVAVSLPLSAGKIVTDSLYSHTLRAEIPFNVYLPEGFDGTQHFPVIYLLHGLSDDYFTWANWGGLQTVADELIRSGESARAVIVMPRAGGYDIHHVWNGYFNMPSWPYEDFFFGEFIPAVEKKYGCGGSKGQRAVMGLSMGGGGSVVYCQRHPDLFSSCYAMSPWLDNKAEEVGTQDSPKDCLYYVGKAVREHSALDFLDNAPEETVEALRTVAWFVDCGDDDFLLHLSVSFHEKMKARGVKSELRVRDGVHNWEYWHLALRMALPFASRNFS